MNNSETECLLMFNRVTNYNPSQKLEIYKKYRTFSKIFAQRSEIERTWKKPFKINGVILNTERLLKSIKTELDYLNSSGISIIPISAKGYPERLRYIYDPPLVLFANGNKELMLSKNIIALVGSRRSSNHSLSMAYTVAKELSEAGCIVASGLALGVDGYAHLGALDGGAGTIAILGNGIDVIYPGENAGIYQRIKKSGVIVSEFPLSTPPYKRNFPMRNRIISGIARGVVVVEASDRSGAMITASYGLDHGREVMAFPGRAGSRQYSGNNALLKEGAYLVEGASDILSVLGIDFDSKSKRGTLFYSGIERDILSIIGEEALTIEQIVDKLKCDVSSISSVLTRLEIQGHVIQYPGKTYRRILKYGE
ncbi:MAG: DNA-protecting protein DprA [Spirochaetes bacterium]|nr:MAG: DNA-protecting protein DprA [Spirochaetota bacterium]